MTNLKSPVIIFGGKSRVSNVVWSRFGKIDNYIEPFCGSLAVLLGNNNVSIETVNDKDCMIINFWRAIKSDPEKVYNYCNDPVSEVELHAKHKFLASLITEEFINKFDDPEFYDSQAAGYWIYGIAASIGSNWLKPKGLNALPILSTAGQSINRKNLDIFKYFQDLSDRLRTVRLSCGDWSKITTPAITYKNVSMPKDGWTAVFLDPPYNQENRNKVYNHDENVFKDVEKWCLENENVNNLRIAVCGYEGDYNLPSWDKYFWKNQGGMSNISPEKTQGKINAKKETIWFSPQCLKGNTNEDQ